MSDIPHLPEPDEDDTQEWPAPMDDPDEAPTVDTEGMGDNG